MEGHEQIREFIAKKRSLEKQVEIQQSEIDSLKMKVEDLQQALSASKRAERFASLITLAQWGKECVVDFMRYPP